MMKSFFVRNVGFFFAVLFGISGCQGCGSAIPDSPDGTVRVVAEKIEAGEPDILWEAMPASYQKDVNALVQLFAAKMDKELWSKGVSVTRKLTKIIDGKKEFILGSPLFAEIEASKKAELVKNWQAISDGLNLIVTSELSKLESLKSFDGKKFLSGTGTNLMKKSRELKSLADDALPGSLKDIKVEVVTQSENTATLKVTTEGKTTEQKMVRIEERWVPVELADKWKKGIAEARKSMTKIFVDDMAQNKPRIMMMLAAVESGLDQLGEAKSQDEFNAIALSLLGGALF